MACCWVCCPAYMRGKGGSVSVWCWACLKQFPRAHDRSNMNTMTLTHVLAELGTTIEMGDEGHGTVSEDEPEEDAGNQSEGKEDVESVVHGNESDSDKEDRDPLSPKDAAVPAKRTTHAAKATPAKPSAGT